MEPNKLVVLLVVYIFDERLELLFSVGCGAPGMADSSRPGGTSPSLVSCAAKGGKKTLDMTQRVQDIEIPTPFVLELPLLQRHIQP